MSTFTERIAVLRRMTGMPGDMTGRVIVDQLGKFMPTTSTKTSLCTILAEVTPNIWSSLFSPITAVT